MNGILDSMVSKTQAFSPESLEQYMALQLAKKLGDTDRLWKYVSLFDRHPPSLIVRAFTNARADGLAERALIVAFENELAAVVTRECNNAL